MVSPVHFNGDGHPATAAAAVLDDVDIILDEYGVR